MQTGCRHFCRRGRSASSTIRDLPSRFVTVCASAPPSWLRLPALPSSTLPTATSARRRWLPRCWPHAATIPAWCMSSRRWKPVPPTSPGTARRPIDTFLRPATGKCLHYYFYFIDAELGLIYLRVPTWCPFRLQFYCNGHSWLARQLTAAGIGFELADNAFLRIDDWQRAQTLADHLSPAALHQVLDRYAKQCCPVFDVFAPSYHWSFMQVEYATDLVFRSQAVLKPLYEQLSRQAILTVKAEHAATFLGHKITPQLAQEIGSQFATRIEGTCVKHRFGKSSIKIYDKFALVLRIETT